MHLQAILKQIWSIWSIVTTENSLQTDSTQTPTGVTDT